MSARSKARKRALDVLFEAEARGVDPLTTLAGRVEQADPPLNPYTSVLVEGVAANRHLIDAMLATYAKGWSLERMPAVDRNVLRIGAYELLWRDDLPDGVAISEAVELVKQLSTDDSPGFVNGLLAHLLELKPTLALTPPARERPAASVADSAAASESR